MKKLFAFFLTLILVSCDKDDETTYDYVVESVGYYNYTVDIFNEIAGFVDTSTGTLEVRQSGSILQIVMDPTTTPEVITLERVTNEFTGYYFDVVGGSVTDPTYGTINRTGQSRVVNSSGIFHGEYSSRQLTFYLSYEPTSPEYAALAFTATVTATR